MSIISQVIVFHGEIEDDLGDDHPAVERMLAWCRENAAGRGGVQVPEPVSSFADLLVMEANFFPCEEFADAFPTFGWNRPEQAVLITQTEYEFTRVVLGNGGHMWWNSYGTGYQAPDYTEEEISEAELRIAALRQSAGMCIKCSTPVRTKVQHPAAEGSLLPTPQQVLDTPMEPNDAGAATIREYLYKLLRDVWHHEEGFNGKRPFGNSGWQYEVFKALGRADYIRIAIDQEGDVEDVDDDAGDALVQAAIASLLEVSPTDPKSEGWAYNQPSAFVAGDASGSTFINCYTNADEFFRGPHEGAVVEYWIGPDDNLQAAVDTAPPGAVIYVHRANRGGAHVGPDGVHLRFLDPDDFEAKTPTELAAEDAPASPSVLPATTPSPAPTVGPPADGDMLFFTNGNRAWWRPYPDGEWTELKA